jgi:hypothetical protein
MNSLLDNMIRKSLIILNDNDAKDEGEDEVTSVRPVIAGRKLFESEEIKIKSSEVTENSNSQDQDINIGELEDMVLEPQDH